MMFKKINHLLPITLLLLCVCGAPYSNDDVLFLLALPRASELKVSIEDERNSQALRTAVDLCPMELATTYLKTRVTAYQLNTSLLAILGIVDVITDYPPTERDEDFRRWGPWTDKDISYRVDVHREKAAEGDQFTYEMNGKRRDEDQWRVILSGQLLEGVTSSEGRGHMTLDFDELRTLNPSSEDEGALEVDYDTRGEGLSLGLLVRSSSIALTSSTTAQIRMAHFGEVDLLARYAFVESENGRGSFQIEAPFDAHEDTEPELNLEEFVTVSTRWREDKRGRAESTIEGGDVQGVLRVSECWDTGYLLNYREGQFNAITASCGNELNCPAEYQEPDFLR